MKRSWPVIRHHGMIYVINLKCNLYYILYSTVINIATAIGRLIKQTSLKVGTKVRIGSGNGNRSPGFVKKPNYTRAELQENVSKTSKL